MTGAWEEIKQKRAYERKRDALQSAAALGYFACLIGLVDGLFLLLHARLGLGFALIAGAVGLSSLIYLAYFIARSLLKAPDAPDPS